MPTIERTLAGESLHFHLPDELKAAENADIMARSGRTARTLVKDAMLRVTVHLLAPGGTIAQHHADGPITVHVLQGSITFSAGERDYELRAGDLLALEPSVQHSVSSKDGGAFLLTAALMPSSR